MKSSHVRNTFYIAAILWIAISMEFFLMTVSGQSKPRQGDGIFTPTISPVAAADKTGRPITIEVIQPEPSFSAVMVGGKPTGDDYTINFPTSSAGGACMYTGTGRYLLIGA